MARILFIDDEAELMSGVINTLGSKHNLTVKTTGSDALAELRENHKQYDLVILDLMLPHGIPKDEADEIPNMPAEEVGEFIFEKMGQFCPDMPTIMLTGVRSNMVGMRKTLNAELVIKPIILTDLLQLIDYMLEAS